MRTDAATIVLTRPQAQATAFADALKAILPAGIGIVISPVLEIRQVAWEPPTRADYAILTSAHAVPGLAQLPMAPDAAVYCVGAATAKAVRDAGFIATVGGGTADDLRRLIEADRPTGAGVHLRGRHVSSDLASDLSGLGFDVVDAIVYDQREAALSAAAMAALTGSESTVLPLFSARSARLVGRQVGAPGPGVRVVALSEGIASAWIGPPDTVTVASAPTADAMLGSVVAACGTRGAC